MGSTPSNGQPIELERVLANERSSPQSAAKLALRQDQFTRAGKSWLLRPLAQRSCQHLGIDQFEHDMLKRRAAQVNFVVPTADDDVMLVVRVSAEAESRHCTKLTLEI